MALVLDTALLPEAERIDALNAAMSTSEVPQVIEHDLSQGLPRHRLEHLELGPRAHLLSQSGTPMHISRGPRHLRVAAPERLVLGSDATPSRRAHLGFQQSQAADELFLVDQTSAYDFDGGSGTKRAFVVDYDVLGLPVDLARRAAPHMQHSPVYQLVRSHFRQLFDDRIDLSTEVAAMLGAATTELLRALVVTATGTDSSQQRESIHALLLLRMKHYVEQHLSEPTLTVETVAAAVNISVRHLYQVWAGNDLTLGQWLMRARLEGARRELARTGSAVAVGRVARRWGFVDAAHFSRRFRAAYGMSPRDWRHLNGPVNPHPMITGRDLTF